MLIPNLERVCRDREYKKYSQEIRDRIVYEYLFNEKSHRWLDANIIGLDPIQSKGWQSMGVLHFLGLKGSFKGVFANVDIQTAINLLSEKDRKDFCEIILALERYGE